MRSYSLVLGLPLMSLLASCSLDSDGDYQVAVTWLINGTAPNSAMCQEQGVARARFEVTTRGGRKVQSVEADCASQLELYQDGGYVPFGGFLTTRAFEWGELYDFKLTLVDAAGTPVSLAAEDSFELRYGEADVYELGYLDYVQPEGRAAALYGEWSVRAGDVAANCAAERIRTVQIEVASALDEFFEQYQVMGEAPCSTGQFQSADKVLATGNYGFRYIAISEGGVVVEAGERIEFFVDGLQDVRLPRENFLN